MVESLYRKSLVLMFLVSLSILSVMIVSLPWVLAWEGMLSSYYTLSPPNLDGMILEDEWYDANLYQDVGKDAMFEVYLMHDDTHMYIGVRAKDTQRNDNDQLGLYFDEGDDDSYGSGSYDGILTFNQEDIKLVYGDGRKLDGYKDEDSIWRASPTSIDFSSSLDYHADHWDFEFMIPFQGKDSRGNDPSDLNIASTDIIGFLLSYIDGGPWKGYSYPPDTSIGDASNWLWLEFLTQFDFNIGVFPESKEIKQGESTSFSVSVDLSSGGPKRVDLSMTGLPIGVDYTFNPSFGDPPFNSTVTLVTIEGVTLGTYNITITGISGEESITVTTTLEIKTSDTDGDGLKDWEEADLGTDPLNTDTDGDFWDDSLEVDFLGLMIFDPTSFLLPNGIIVGIMVLLIILGFLLRRQRKKAQKKLAS